MVSPTEEEGCLGLGNFELKLLWAKPRVTLLVGGRLRGPTQLVASCLHRSQLLHPPLPVQEWSNVFQQRAAELHLHLPPGLHWCGLRAGTQQV